MLKLRAITVVSSLLLGSAVAYGKLDETSVKQFLRDQVQVGTVSRDTNMDQYRVGRCETLPFKIECDGYAVARRTLAKKPSKIEDPRSFPGLMPLEINRTSSGDDNPNPWRQVFPVQSYIYYLKDTKTLVSFVAYSLSNEVKHEGSYQVVKTKDF